MNLLQAFFEQARRRPDATALVTPDRRIGYGELSRLVDASAACLHQQGVRSGDVLAMGFVDELALSLAMLGATRMGATLFCLAQNHTEVQRKAWAAAAKARLLLSDRPEQFDAGIPATPFTVDRLQAGVGASSAHAIHLALEPVAPVMIRIGSGSTGKQKLMAISHAQMRERCRILNLAEGNADAERALALPHLAFGTAHQRLMATLASGSAFILWDRTRSDILRVLVDSEATIVHGTVFHIERILQAIPPGRTIALPRMRILTLGSSTVADPLRARIRDRLTGRLFVNYGTNEIGTIALVGPPDVFGASGTVGKPVSGVEVEVVDKLGRTLPAGTVGRIRIRSRAAIDGYQDDDEATRKAFVEGWFHPGDLGRFDETGALIFCGRQDDLMIKNGINIYPAEIEQVMMAHPAVADAAAVPARHPVHQDVPLCAVALRDGMSASEDSLRAHARAQLGFRCPQRVFVLDRIPRTEQGKLRRSDLARQINGLLDEA